MKKLLNLAASTTFFEILWLAATVATAATAAVALAAVFQLIQGAPYHREVVGAIFLGLSSIVLWVETHYTIEVWKEEAESDWALYKVQSDASLALRWARWGRIALYATLTTGAVVSGGLLALGGLSVVTGSPSAVMALWALLGAALTGWLRCRLFGVSPPKKKALALSFSYYAHAASCTCCPTATAAPRSSLPLA